MKLEFETIGELEQFLIFSAHIGRAFATAPTPADPDPHKYEPASLKNDQETVSVNNGTSSEPAAVLSVGDPAGNEAVAEAVGAAVDAPASTDTPKRKRRTKAEMEAERTAVGNVAAGQTPATTSTSGSDGSSAGAPANAGAADQGDEPAAAPLGNPFAMTAAAIQTAISAHQSERTMPPVAQPSIHERAGAILTDTAAVESIAHLRACQGFIQKHGMPKYNESFTEGLNANIAAYSPEQRALHLAILESLDA